MREALEIFLREFERAYRAAQTEGLSVGEFPEPVDVRAWIRIDRTVWWTMGAPKWAIDLGPSVDAMHVRGNIARVIAESIQRKIVDVTRS